MRATEPSEVTSNALHDLLHEMFGQTMQPPAEADGSIRVGMRSIKMSGIGASQPSAPNAFSACQTVAFPPELSAAVKEVRDDTKPTDWALARLGDDGQSLTLAGSGTGGAEGLAAHLTSDAAYYGIIRVTDLVDRSSTIKFAFLAFLGEDLSPMRRAKASTIKGSVSSVFAPFHAEMVGLTDASEVRWPPSGLGPVPLPPATRTHACRPIYRWAHDPYCHRSCASVLGKRRCAGHSGWYNKRGSVGVYI
jgi:hypothetical protein